MSILDLPTAIATINAQSTTTKMNIRDEIAQEIDYRKQTLRRARAMLEWFEKYHPSILERTSYESMGHPSYTTLFSTSVMSGILSFNVTDREQLQDLMVLAPRWEKSEGYGGTINYKAYITDDLFGNDSLLVQITAADGALPPTCKVVEKEEVVPAQPERIVKKKVVVCSGTTFASTDASTEAST